MLDNNNLKPMHHMYDQNTMDFKINNKPGIYVAFLLVEVSDLKEEDIAAVQYLTKSAKLLK
jgi:hypothetical protein|tara:strand:+ start:84 stop:266 length:183 start_codon:yes stop_codon:yes gene_type:complete